MRSFSTTVRPSSETWLSRRLVKPIMSVHYGLAGTGSIHYGLIRNASKKGRDFVLQMVAGDAASKGFGKAAVRLQGGEAVSLKSGSSVTLAGMLGSYRQGLKRG